MNLLERLRIYEDTHRGVSTRGFAGLDYTCRQLYENAMPIGGARVLELGGGEGYFGFWALAQGARSVVNLEPETAGSTTQVSERSRRHAATLGLGEDRYRLLGLTLQEYPITDGRFDIILSSSSVNHLDEEACTGLGVLPTARATYLDIFEKVGQLLTPGGRFIVHDAARGNYWNAIGLASPFSPTIEWNKHQEPSTWRTLIEAAGLRYRACRWLRYYRLRTLGPLNGSAVVARATLSQFILTMERPAEKRE
jgi:SAM-dependent methyltransferase